MARVRPLREPTIPIAGESARGLFCRAAGRHGVPLSFTILRHLGMQHRNVVTIAEDEHLDVAGMARIIRVDPGEIEQRRYRSLGPKRYSFFGLELSTSAIEKKVRRFAPASLVISGHIRAEWELRDLPFCAETWDMLTDRCACGVVQGWIRLNRGVHRCDDCGRQLAMVVVDKVPSHLQGELLFFAGLVSPIVSKSEEAVARLPATLRRVDRTEFFNCIRQLRRAVAGPDPDPIQDLEALHAACRAIVDWPTGIATLKPADTSPPTAWPAATAAYGRLGSKVDVPKRRDQNEAAGECVDGLGGQGGERRDRLIGIRPACELARLTPETLLAGRKLGHVGDHEHMRGGKLVDAFLPAELRRFADEVRRRRTAEAVGYRLGAGGRAIRDIVMAGHMTASGIQLAEDELVLVEEDVAGLLEKLRVDGGLADPVPLKVALMHVRGRPKPWGDLVGALLTGRIAFHLCDQEGRFFDRLQVDRGDIPVIRTMASRPPSADERVTSHEALELLNANQNCGALRMLPSVGGNPVTYLLTDVVDLAMRGITVLEAATTTNRTLGSTFHLIKSRSVGVVADKLYCLEQLRAKAPELLS